MFKSDLIPRFSQLPALPEREKKRDPGNEIGVKLRQLNSTL